MYLDGGLRYKLLGLYVHYVHCKSLWLYHVASQHLNWWIHSVSYMDNTRILIWGEEHFGKRCTYSLYYTQTLKKKEWWRKQEKWSKSMKPFKKHYVQCGDSLSGRCATELMFLNKIKRVTTQNNIDNKGRDGTEASDRRNWGGGQRNVWYVHVCKPLQVSQ